MADRPRQGIRLGFVGDARFSVRKSIGPNRADTGRLSLSTGNYLGTGGGLPAAAHWEYFLPTAANGPRTYADRLDPGDLLRLAADARLATTHPTLLLVLYSGNTAADTVPDGARPGMPIRHAGGMG